MPKPKMPRHGSMQFWPRKRAKRPYPRIRSWAKLKDAKPLGFAGYKAGMTHVGIIDNRKNSMTKGSEVFFPATIIECPPIRVFGVRFYRETEDGTKSVTQINAKVDKDLKRKISAQKKESKSIDGIKPEDYDDLVLIVQTQPRLTGIGKKKPELFELAIGGKKEEKIGYAKNVLGKEILIKDVFKEGEQIDIHAVTKGKGFQGPVKRFGVKIRQHKSEKTKRGPGSLGAWCGQQHMMYRVAHAGQMGYHQRVDYNKWLLKISEKPEEVNPKGGFLKYGTARNSCIILKGSVPGPRKRMITLIHATRPDSNVPKEAPRISYISLSSKQGN